MRLHTMETAGINSSIATQVGAATTVGSGAVVVFGQTLSQIEVATASMFIGAIIGFAGLVANVIFKWLAHKEMCRANIAVLQATRLRDRK